MFFVRFEAYRLCFIDEHTTKRVRLTEAGPDGQTLSLLPPSPHLTNIDFWRMNMNTKTILAAVALFAAAGSTFAQGNSEFDEFTNFVSTRTRAEVQAELAQANAQGQVAHAPEFVEYTRVASTVATSPATPRAQARVAQKTSYDQAILSREPEFVEHVNIASGKSRAEVREEMLQAAGNVGTTIGG